ncbi:hypothetical protein GEMRC1_011594 [Eukaryota sp. GEM-RC1]
MSFSVVFSFFFSIILANMVQTFKSGSYCPHTETGVKLICTPTEYSRFQNVFSSPPPDLNAHSLLVAFYGQANSGGYSVEITNATVHHSTKAIHVDVRYSSPPPGMMVTMAITQPFHSVLIEKVDPTYQLKVTTTGHKPVKPPAGNGHSFAFM